MIFILILVNKCPAIVPIIKIRIGEWLRCWTLSSNGEVLGGILTYIEELRLSSPQEWYPRPLERPKF